MPKPEPAVKEGPVLQYDPKRPIFIMNEEGHKRMSIITDMLFRKYGNEALAIYSELVPNNVVVSEKLMFEFVDILNKNVSNEKVTG